uniref:Uncharacterized protein n=1 Tax=Helianthus annuus TaxID=4232 RepID=A0A251SP03_HELAN
MIQIHRNQCWWCFNGEGGGVTAFNDEKQKRQREREREREEKSRESGRRRWRHGFWFLPTKTSRC